MNGQFAGICGIFALTLGAQVAFPNESPADSSRSAPRVQFDTETLVAVEEIVISNDVAADSSSNNLAGRLVDSSQRLMRTRLRISVLYPPDSERDLAEVLLRVESPDRTMRIVDYAPRTTMISDVAGAVRVDKHEEASQSFDFELKGNYPGIAEGHVKGDRQRKSTVDSHWEKLPSLELNVASGTVNRGCGVYFKFKPSHRSTLEGDHEVELVWSVPRTWRGDCLVVKAEAYGRETTLVAGESSPRHWCERRFLVALHEQGDTAARAEALAMLRAESRLRQAVLADRGHSRTPAPWRDFSSWIQGGGGAGAAQWWESVAYGAAVDPWPAFPERSSATVREAAARYREARLRLHRLPPGDAATELATHRGKRAEDRPVEPWRSNAVAQRYQLERLPPVE